jgi:hypothetical protein
VAEEPPAFAPRTFKVVWDHVSRPPGLDEASTIRRGFAQRSGQASRVCVTLRDRALHAVAAATSDRSGPVPDVHRRVALVNDPTSPWCGSLEELLPRLSGREASGVRSRVSAAVRIGAKVDLAKLLGVCESRVEIVRAPRIPGRGPPRILVDGEEADADVSLSHDGRWIAWALWVGSGQERR